MNWSLQRFIVYNSDMTLTLTAEQQQALFAEPNQPLQLVDDKGTRTWYVISAEQYQAMQSVFSETEFRPEELAPLIAQAAADAGWADPLMDGYDNYDEHRAKV